MELLKKFIEKFGSSNQHDSCDQRTHQQNNFFIVGASRAFAIIALVNKTQSLQDELRPELVQNDRNNLDGDVLYYSLNKINGINLENCSLAKGINIIDGDAGGKKTKVGDICKFDESKIEEDSKGRYRIIRGLKESYENLKEQIKSEVNLIKQQPGLGKINENDITIQSIIRLVSQEQVPVASSVDGPDLNSINNIVKEPPSIPCGFLRRKDVLRLKIDAYKKALDDYYRDKQECIDKALAKYKMEVHRNEVAIELYEKRKKAEIEELMRDNENRRKIALMRQEQYSDLIEKAADVDKLCIEKLSKNCTDSCCSLINCLKEKMSGCKLVQEDNIRENIKGLIPDCFKCCIGAGTVCCVNVGNKYCLFLTPENGKGFIPITLDYKYNLACEKYPDGFKIEVDFTSVS